MRMILLAKYHLTVKFVLFGLFFDKFFDLMEVNTLKIYQRMNCFFYLSKFRKMSLLIQVLLLWGIRSIEAQDFEAHIHPSSTQLSIAETLNVDLDLVYPPNYSINLNALRQNLLRSSHFYEHPFAIQEMKMDAPQIRNDGLYTQHIQILLRPLRVGNVYLTFYDLVFDSKDPKRPKQRVVSDVYPIEVTPIKTEATPKGLLAPLMTFSKEVPMELSPQNQSHWVDSPSVQQRQNEINVLWMDQKRLPWISILSFLIVAFALWFFLKNPLTRPSLTSMQAELLAKKEALLQLEKLQELQLPEKGRFEDFYTQLTQPIRQYIEKRYRLPASTSTTPEFLSEMAVNPNFPLAMRQQLSQFMIQADRVKFGRHLPSIDECKQAEKMAFQFILNEKKT